MVRALSNVIFSRVTAKYQTVLPRAVREALGVKPGDTLRYRLTDRGVLIDRVRAKEDEPFDIFSEWSGESDERGYADL